MTHNLTLATTILGLLLMAGLALAAEPADGARIQAAIAGNTVQGAMQASGAYTEHYAADGTIRGDGYTGAWSIEGDAMCFQYGSDPKSCWQVAIDGDQVSWIRDGKVDGTGTIVPGNPNGF